MRKVLTDAQFTEAVYRHYNGSTLSEIADYFGIGVSTLSETRKRSRAEWDRIRDKIIESEIAALKTDHSALDVRTREIMTHLFSLVSQLKGYDEIVLELSSVHSLTAEESDTYITHFEALLPVRIPRASSEILPLNTHPK